MNKPDMSAFIGRGFDLEIMYTPTQSDWRISQDVSHHPHILNSDYIIRPRLNKPQVLDDWSWLPDGFVWRACAYDSLVKLPMFHKLYSAIPSKYLKATGSVIWAECIGVTEEYREWGESVGMEVVDCDPA